MQRICFQYLHCICVLRWEMFLRLYARCLHADYKQEVNYQDMGNCFSCNLPSIYPDVKERLTSYGMSLFLKQVQASQKYVVQPCSTTGDSIDAFVADVDELQEPDLRDLPRYKTLQQVMDSNGILPDADTFPALVRLKHTIQAVSNPQFVVLTDKVEGKGCYHGYLCTCGSTTRTGVPCRHFWAVLQHLPDVAFHFGMVNDLWFKKAQPPQESLQLYSFNTGHAHHHFNFQRALFAAPPPLADGQHDEQQVGKQYRYMSCGKLL